jgi:adenylosuccinate synthase
MPNVVITGTQWGDEGKGKVVDLLSGAFDLVVRYQGGHNAGHTVKFEDRHFSLHLVPSGILRPQATCVLGNGMVIDPEAFFGEVERLEGMGVTTRGRLFASDRAHTILPTHKVLDRCREEAAGSGKIGTTVRGIGPCYETKAARFGVRLCDLGAADLGPRLEPHLRVFSAEMERLGGDPTEGTEELVARCREWAERFRPYLRDTGELLNGAIREGRSVLFEGAQGVLLDLDHGTYPFVTSSSPIPGGVCTGAGVPPTRLDGVVGVMKAYTTRVGGGPFVVEEHGETGEYLRSRGNEYGTTTGRPRRCGWLDLVAVRYACQVAGVDALALTKLDVLDTFDEIRVCVAYRIGGERVERFPALASVLEEAEPEYLTVPGWKEETVGTLDYSRLPAAARRYVELLEERLVVPVALVSTGPRREETILRDLPVVERLGLGQAV